MAGELNASLNLDLSHLTFQLKQLESRVSESDQRIEAVHQRAARMRRQVDETNALTQRLEARVTSIGRSLARQGVAFATSRVIERAADGAHVPGATFLGGVAADTFQGAAVGGLPGAAIAAVVSTATRLIGEFTQLRKDLEAEKQARRDAMADARRRIAEAESNAQRAMELLDLNASYERQQVTKQAREMAYRASLYISRRAG